MARSAKNSEKTLLWVVFLMTLFGLVLLVSTSVPLSQQTFGESYYFLRHQLIFGFLAGLILFFIARKIKPQTLKKLALPIFAFSIFLLLIVLIPQFSYKSGGAQRWLTISSFSFQPAEIAKIAMIIYLAAWFDKRHLKITKTSTLVPFLIILGLVAGLILMQPDLGTATLIIGTAFAMYFAAGARIQTFISVLLLVAILAGALIMAKPYRRARVFSFLNPTHDTQGEGYQLNQALIAIGSGGTFGRGLGDSVQKHLYLPESIGDAIFAIIGEELGFLGTVVTLILFLIFILSGIKIALSSRTRFGSLLVVGLVSWIGLQTLINVGGISGLMPFTGIPLPFISYGGTALALELGAVGLISSVARH